MGAADGRVRAFVAVELDAETRTAIAELIERLRPQLPGVSWSAAENAHVTLRFLGNVTGEFLERYSQRMRQVAAPLHPMCVRLAGVGAFPTLRRPSILWAGVRFDTQQLVALHRGAEDAARELGLEPEPRPFTPHVTLGRVKRNAGGAEVRGALEREREFQAHEFMVESVSLFSSELTQHGARHTRLHRFSFDGIRGQSGI